MYCAFIDFSKAYDRVDRKIMWACLRSCGLHGAALQAVMGMYENVRMQVRAGGELAEPFTCEVGVRQGDPLSPLLFGLLIDRLESFIVSRCGDAGVGIAERVVRALLYADDVSLPASTPASLQSMLDCLSEFCVANGMYVNMSKSAVVVFNRKACTRRQLHGLVFTYNGQPLAVQGSYVYLGIEFTDDKCVAVTAPAMALEKARKSLFAMYGRCAVLGIHNACVLSMLFDTHVVSRASYGSEVWAPDYVAALLNKQRGLSNGLMEEKLHRPFMRKVLGVCKTTPLMAMLCELDRMPLSVHWLKLIISFWNRAVRRPVEDYLHAAMAENVCMAADMGMPSHVRQRMWAFHFLRCMQYIGKTCVGTDGGMMRVDLNEALAALERRWLEDEWNVVNSMHGPWLLQPCAVRSAPEGLKGFKLLTYCKWFRCEDTPKQQRYTFCLDRYDQIRIISQFRTGSHWLGIQQGRYRKQTRAQRTCGHCSGEVEDEMHIFYCPQYSALRYELNITVPAEQSDACMRACMNGYTPDQWVALANFLLRCRAMCVSI
jgi:hypothetical protein